MPIKLEIWKKKIDFDYFYNFVIMSIYLAYTLYFYFVILILLFMRNNILIIKQLYPMHNYLSWANIICFLKSHRL